MCPRGLWMSLFDFSGAMTPGGFGGLPPTDQSNPRRGSATGSYGLPVPPEWMRTRYSAKSGASASSLLALAQGRESPPISNRKKSLKPLNVQHTFLPPVIQVLKIQFKMSRVDDFRAVFEFSRAFFTKTKQAHFSATIFALVFYGAKFKHNMEIYIKITVKNNKYQSVILT